VNTFRKCLVTESSRTLVAKIERDLLARGIFTSLSDLARKIRRYITRYNEEPKPIRWTYRNPAHRVTPHASAGSSAQA
jgi:hypothetical protein